MSLQTKNVKGVSIIIGYVLLITFAIIIAVAVYGWMKTYVPKDTLSCPADVSIFVKDYQCNSTQLDLTLKNNGKFNIGGYFIYYANTSTQDIATANLSFYAIDKGSVLQPSGIKFGDINSSENNLKPNDEEIESFNITSLSGSVYMIQVLPLRWQVEKNKRRVVSCTDAQMREVINC